MQSYFAIFVNASYVSKLLFIMLFLNKRSSPFTLYIFRYSKEAFVWCWTIVFVWIQNIEIWEINMRWLRTNLGCYNLVLG